MLQLGVLVPGWVTVPIVLHVDGLCISQHSVAILSWTCLRLILNKIPQAPMGVLIPGLHTWHPLLGPPSTLAKIFHRMWLQSQLQTSPPIPQKSYPKFQNSTASLSRKYLKLANFPVKIGLIGGVGDVPDSSPRLKSSNYCYLGAHVKNRDPIISFPGIYLKLAHFPVKIGLIRGVGGVPEFRFSLESSSFCFLGAHAKNWDPIISFPGIYLKLAHFPVKKGLIWGVWGVPEFFF